MHIINKTQYNISAVYLDTNNHITKTKIESIVTKLHEENQEHPNNMILGDFNFIDHEKDKINGLNNTDKLVCKVWQPFLSQVDMVDPFREQNPKRKIWSFIGTGRARNSRIDRLYVNAVNMINITNIQYIPTPFGGHRVLTFTKKNDTQKGKGYYKMNTSILKDSKYKEIVAETIQELENLQIKDDIRKWGTFLQSIRSKSVSYSQEKCKIKARVKEVLRENILKIEEDPLQLDNCNILDQYNYYKRKLKEIEEIELEGYKRRVKYIPSFEK